jgi:predicted RNase H-like HicB family nuclease
MKYLIVIEQTRTGFSAYSPDLPGCVATGATRDEVEREMQSAIAFHVEGLRAEGMVVPPPPQLIVVRRDPGLIDCLHRANRQHPV